MGDGGLEEHRGERNGVGTGEEGEGSKMSSFFWIDVGKECGTI